MKVFPCSDLHTIPQPGDPWLLADNPDALSRSDLVDQDAPRTPPQAVSSMAASKFIERESRLLHHLTDRQWSQRIKSMAQDYCTRCCEVAPLRTQLPPDRSLELDREELRIRGWIRVSKECSHCSLQVLESVLEVDLPTPERLSKVLMSPGVEAELKRVVIQVDETPVAERQSVIKVHVSGMLIYTYDGEQRHALPLRLPNVSTLFSTELTPIRESDEYLEHMHPHFSQNPAHYKIATTPTH